MAPVFRFKSERATAVVQRVPRTSYNPYHERHTTCTTTVEHWP